MQEEAGTRPSGFTVVEALAAAGLAAVLAGTATVRMVELVQSARLAGAARTLATTLRLARARALAADATIEVRFDAAAGTSETRDRSGRLLETARLPAGVDFAALPARQRLFFTGLGGADNATVTLGAGARRRSVVVNQRGRIRFV